VILKKGDKMKVKMKIKIRTLINENNWADLFESEVEVENTHKGVCAALLGWNKQQHDDAQKLYDQYFGVPYDETNVRLDVSIIKDGVEVLNEGRGFFIHFFGQRKYVIHGLKETENIMFGEVNGFIRNACKSE